MEWTRNLEQQLRAAGYRRSEIDEIKYEVTRGNSLDYAMQKVDEKAEAEGYKGFAKLNKRHEDGSLDFKLVDLFEETRRNVWKKVKRCSYSSYKGYGQPNPDGYIYFTIGGVNYKITDPYNPINNYSADSEEDKSERDVYEYYHRQRIQRPVDKLVDGKWVDYGMMDEDTNGMPRDTKIESDGYMYFELFGDHYRMYMY